MHMHLSRQLHSCSPAYAPRQLRRNISLKASRSDDLSGPFDDRDKRALREAGEILSEAQELARQQTLADLVSSWAADSATQQALQQLPPAAAGAPPSPAAPPAAAGPSSSSSTAGAAAQSPNPVADSNSMQQSSSAALEAFWCEQGLSQLEAQQLLKEVAAYPQLAASCCNTQLLSQKLSSLSRVLPAADVPRLITRTPQLLLVPSSTAVQILVDLVAALPGCDVMDMVSRQPRLLLQDPSELPGRLQAILAKLQALHPSHMQAVVAGIIEENPELVLRMQYYLGDDVRLLDDLPIEIQNMMVLGDHGVGYLYRYWNNRLTERPRRSQWDTGGSSSAS